MVLFESVKQFTLHLKAAYLGLNITVAVHHITASNIVLNRQDPYMLINSYTHQSLNLTLNRTLALQHFKHSKSNYYLVPLITV